MRVFIRVVGGKQIMSQRRKKSSKNAESTTLFKMNSHEMTEEQFHQEANQARHNMDVFSKLLEREKHRSQSSETPKDK